jgi:HK97 family phage prohead protease
MTRTLTTMTTERRSIARDVAGIQLRADDSGDERFVGLALVYGTRAKIGDPKTWGFFEEFAPGAATKTLAEFDQRMLIDHDTYYIVSRVSAGDLGLTQTGRGVEVDSALDEELTYVRDLKVNVRKKRITGMSIGFRTIAGKVDWQQIEVEEPRDDGKIEVYTADLRIIREIQLLEVSAVTFPAFEDTEADLRHGVIPALELRGDHDAIARRAKYRPELASLLEQIDREPASATRAGTEPARTTRYLDDSIDRHMRGMATRYGLPLANRSN